MSPTNYNVQYYIGENAVNTVEPYFYLQNATLENGSIFVLKPSNDFSLQVGKSVEIRLLYAAQGEWNTENLILRLDADSPLLNIEWSNLTDQNNLIVTAHFLTPQQGGLSLNAGRAVNAALADGVFTFDSNPEDWIADVSGAMAMGASAGLRHSLGNLQNRIGSMHGLNSGDETVCSQGLWYEGGYSDADQKRRDGVTGFNAQTTHFSLGYDIKGDNALLGVAYTHSGTNLHGNNSAQKMDSTDHFFSVYGRYDFTRLFVQGFATYGHGSIDSYRSISTQLLEAVVDSRLYAISSQIGIETTAGDWQIVPMVSFEYDKQHFDGYQEIGGTLALDVASQDYEIFNISSGVSCERNLVTTWGHVTPELTAMVYYDVIGDRMQAASHFVGGQTSFISHGTDPAQTSWEVSPSITIGSAGEYPISLKISYTYAGKEDFESSSISGELRFEF